MEKARDVEHNYKCSCIIYTDPIAVRSNAFGTGMANVSVPILLNNVNCEGHEENIITECGHNGVNDFGECRHVQDAGVICQGMHLECIYLLL